MAFQFNGSSQYATLASTAVPTSQGTLAGWVRFDTITGSRPVVTFRTLGTPVRVMDIFLVSGSLQAGWYNAGNDDRVQHTWSPTAGAWHHLAVTWVSGGATTLYIDGSSVATTSSLDATWDTTTGSAGVAVDVRNTSLLLHGGVAELALWSAAVDAAEIAALARGIAPLCLSHRIGQLVLYQDLLKSANRPGIGPMLTPVGSPLAARHPRIVSLSSGLAGVIRRFHGPRPYWAEAGGVALPGAEMAQADVAGAVAGQAV